MYCQKITIFFSLPVFFLFFLWSISLAQPYSAAPADPPDVPTKMGTVSGRFIVEGGGEMAGGNVMFYNAESAMPPKFSQYIRVPSLSTVIEPDGSFQTELPVGNYYLFAIKKNTGKKFGKPRKGDYLFKLREENSSALKPFLIRENEHIDLGMLMAVAKQDKGKPARLLTENTTIEGTIRDTNGNPVKDGSVFAYSTPRMQKQRPLFVSNFTGDDGKYSLRVAGERTYYLMVRDVLGGGKLEVGEIIGVYGEHIPAGVAVKTGETLVGKDIKVITVQPRGPREEFEAREKSGIPSENIFSGYLAGEIVMEDGTPLSGAIVYLFNTKKQQSGDGVFWGRLDQIVGQVDNHGKFKLKIPVGNYNLAIIKRASGEALEPLREGDIYYLHRFSESANKTVTISEGGETDLGRLVGHRYTAGGIADYPDYIGIASISGTLTDREGKFLAGASILIYREPGRLGPPVFSAGPSKADGSYQAMFHEEGTYYLVAKLGEKVDSATKGLSQPGIMLGRYGGEKDTPLVIQKNVSRKGIDIVLQPVGLQME